MAVAEHNSYTVALAAPESELVMLLLLVAALVDKWATLPAGKFSGTNGTSEAPRRAGKRVQEKSREIV